MDDLVSRLRDIGYCSPEDVAEAADRIKALEGSLAKYLCNCPYPCALYDAEKAKEADMPHMMCGWWAKSVLENPK
jgi:hypothetical protein